MDIDPLPRYCILLWSPNAPGPVDRWTLNMMINPFIHLRAPHSPGAWSWNLGLEGVVSGWGSHHGWLGLPPWQLVPEPVRLPGLTLPSCQALRPNSGTPHSGGCRRMWVAPSTPLLSLQMLTEIPLVRSGVSFHLPPPFSFCVFLVFMYSQLRPI